MAEPTEQVLVTIPKSWNIKEHAKMRKFHMVQDLIRELIRRDIENKDEVV